MAGSCATTLEFLAELNDFLPAGRRRRAWTVRADPAAPLRHLIEVCGVPHTEVALVLRGDETLDLERPVVDGDRLRVFPLGAARRLRPALRDPVDPRGGWRFLADTHLGRLARQLRMLGFDTLWSHEDPGDERLAEGSAAGGRILLSSDRRLLMRRGVRRGCFIRSAPVGSQLSRLIERFELCGELKPFSRCLLCNAPIAPVAFAEVRARVPPRVRQTTDRYWRCGGCGQVYWRGTHWQHMRERMRALCPGLVESGSA